MLDRLERGLVAANRWLLIALLTLMACIVFINVVLRYTTGDSIFWAEEAARYLMIWGTFLGAGLVLRLGGHIAIDNLHKALEAKWGAKAAQGLRALVAVALGVFFLVMTYFAALYCWATRFQTTAAMEIPFAWVYAAMPVGFALMFVHLLFVARGYVRDGRYVESDEMDAEAAASL